MKQRFYTDGTPSRELADDDDDWETSGEEETRKLHERSKCPTTILGVRDRLNRAQDLVTVCHLALDESNHVDIKEIVSNILYFFVNEELKTAEQELKSA